MRFRTAEERMDDVVMFAAEGTLTVRLFAECRLSQNTPRASGDHVSRLLRLSMLRAALQAGGGGFTGTDESRRPLRRRRTTRQGDRD